MSSNVFLKSDNANFSGGSLIRVLQAYVPPAILKKANLAHLKLTEKPKFENEGAEYVKTVFDNSNNELQMYGSVAEMCQNLKTFRNVPYDHLLFGLDICETYATSPILYKDEENSDVFICKHDVYVHTQNIILDKFDFVKNNALAKAVIVAFLKVSERVLIRTNEFVKSSDNNFKKIEQDLVKFSRAECQDAKYENRKLKLVDFSFEEIIDQYKKLIPCDWNDVEFKTIGDLLAAEINRADPRLRPGYHRDTYMNCLQICDKLHDMFNTYKKLFKPYVKWKMAPRIIKVFVDGDRKIVPVEDMVQGMGIEQPTFVTWNIHTVDAELWKENLDLCRQSGVQIIHIPIIRTNHTAQYVYHINGMPYKLAIDVFFELFYEWIFGYQLFEKLASETDWDKIKQFFEEFSWVFSDQTDLYFIDKDQIEKIQNRSHSMFSEIVGRPVKNVRKMKPNKFSVNNLKKDLQKLGLSTVVSDIDNCATRVYEHVVEKKKGQTLRNCDIFEATFQRQMSLFLKKFPTWVSFIHNQNGCKRIVEIDCHCRKPTPSPISSKTSLMARPIAKAVKKSASEVAEASAPNVPNPFRLNLIDHVMTELEQTKEKLAIAEKKLQTNDAEFQKERYGFNEFKKNAIAEKEELLKKLEESNNRNETLDSLHTTMYTNMEYMKGLMVTAIGPERREKMKPVLADLQTKQTESAAESRKANEKFNKLIHLPTNQVIKQTAKEEMLKFNDMHSQHIHAIEKNIAGIRGNPMTTHSDLIPVPNAPRFPEVLEHELILAEEKNEKMGKECLVCREEKLETEECVKCASCPTTFHKQCVVDWIKAEPKCVCPLCGKNLKL